MCARCILALIEEERAKDNLAGKKKTQPPTHGYFHRYLWSFVGGGPVLNSWATPTQTPTQSTVAIAMSADLKRRGFKFVGPTICYSLMQSCGLVIDHPKDTPEWEAARVRLAARPP